MKTKFITLILSLLGFNCLFAQNNNIDYVGNYKAKSQGENYMATVDKDNKAIFTSIGYYYKYECSCKMLNQNTLGCYMVKLLEGKNSFNPKPGEFLFAIIYENGNYYPFLEAILSPLSMICQLLN